MAFLPLLAIFTVILLSSRGAHADGLTSSLNSILSVWARPCTACAPVEMLRATAFGIELSPDYVTFAMKFPNGTVSRLVKIQPEVDFWKLCIQWMEDTRSTTINPAPGFLGIVRNNRQTAIVEDQLQTLLDTISTRYPGLAVEFGAVSIPGYIPRDTALHTIFRDAIHRTPFATQNKGLHLIHATDLAVTAFTETDEKSNSGADDVDTLVITNTPSFLSASWYESGFIPSFIGQFVEPKPDARMRALAPDSQQPSSATSLALKVDTDHSDAFIRLASFIREREALHSTTRPTRLILRHHSTSKSASHGFAPNLLAALSNTRFDPVRPGTTVYRHEDVESWTWAAASHVANKTKARINASRPAGCVPEHEVCAELRDCVRREALGELVLCEDVEIPEPTLMERMEKGVEAGAWAYWSNNMFPWISLLLTELEARLFLVYCSPRMPWSASPSVIATCEDALVELPGSETGEMGVYKDYLGLGHITVLSASRYWMDGCVGALAHPPLFWFGLLNSLKVVVWAVSRMVGPENFEHLVKMALDLWETLQPLYEQIAGMGNLEIGP